MRAVVLAAGALAVALAAAPATESSAPRPLLTFTVSPLRPGPPVAAGFCMSRADGTHRLRLRSLGAWSPAWSRDGRRLAFVGNVESGSSHYEDVFVSDARGVGVRVISGRAEAPLNLTPTWSPDGRRVAYYSGWGVGRLLVTEVDRPARTRPLRTGSVENPTDPQWSPDGRWLMFTGRSPTESGIFVMRSNGAGRPRLVADGAVPTWSPDGGRIAYVVQGSRGEPAKLVVALRDGTQARVVVENAYGRLAWSPSGSLIAFIRADTADRPMIVGVDLRTGRERVLVRSDRYRVSDPVWRPARPLPRHRYRPCTTVASR